MIQFAIATSRATPAPSGDSAAVVVAQEHFAAVFGEWTATPLGQYASGNIYVDPETGWIKAARFPFSLQPRSDPEVAARQLEALRRVF